MTTSAHRTRICLALALLVHAGLLSSYVPRALVQIGKALEQLLPVPSAEPAAQAGQTQTARAIPVTLPGGNLQLQTELGSLKTAERPRDKPKRPDFSQLPKRQSQLAAQMDISGSLRDAADQAARAEAVMRQMMAQAQAQARVEEEFVADIVLADSAASIAPRRPMSPEAQQAAANPAPAAPLRKQAPPPARRRAPPPAEPPAPQTLPPAGREDVQVEVYPAPEPAPPALLPPPAQDPDPQAALFIPGMPPAPDRGPGAYSDSASLFFSQLTAHLFRANQLALANAVRADRRLTLDVRFYIGRDGRILGAQVVRSTGNAELDRKAEQVILDASPVPQLAPDMPQQRLELSFPVDIYR